MKGVSPVNWWYRQGLVVRLFLPILLLLAVLVWSLHGLHSYMAGQVYRYQVNSSLNNTLTYARSILAAGKNEKLFAQLANRRKERIPQIKKILGSRLEYLQTTEQTGLLLMDKGGLPYLVQGHQDIAALEPALQDLLKYEDGLPHKLTAQDGSLMVGTYYAPLESFLVAYDRRSFELLPFQQQINRASLLLLWLGAGLTLLYLLFLVHQAVQQPLRQLYQSIHGFIQSRQFNHSLDSSGSVEMQQLTGQFNTLLQHIQERDKKLEEQNTSLEKLVAERTLSLQQAQEQLVRHERLAAIGEFAASIVHELRNPLTAISLGIEQIKRTSKDMDEKNQRRLALAHKEVGRLNAMLKGILSFAANTPTQMQTINISEFFANQRDVFSAIVEAQGCVYASAIPALTCEADPNLLTQCLINLLKNAAEASPEGDVVTVSAARVDGRVTIDVHNEGKPLSPSVEKRLFEPFFTTKPQGTGLGLATTKKLMEAMGGDVQLASHKKSGTVATLVIPA